jgi:tRNA (mo5U34)-methyltransferase
MAVKSALISEKESWVKSVQWARSISHKYFYPSDILSQVLKSEDGYVILGELSGSEKISDFQEIPDSANQLMPGQSLKELNEIINSPDHLIRRELRGMLAALKPWRKGPFRIMGETVQASWRSDRKYERVIRNLKSREFEFKDSSIADVGCNNGYYMFRLLEENPTWVLGMDPVPVMHRQFQFLHSFYPHPALEFVRAGFDHLENYSGQFDLILNMGIIYHHTDPVEILRLCRQALKPGGTLYLESMGFVPESGSKNAVLFPAGKYAGANGIWFLPSAEAMGAMLIRCGFRDVVIHETHDYAEEQQETDYSQSPGLDHFLSQDDSGRVITKEGYPEPVRIHVTAIA